MGLSASILVATVGVVIYRNKNVDSRRLTSGFCAVLVACSLFIFTVFFYLDGQPWGVTTYGIWPTNKFIPETIHYQFSPRVAVQKASVVELQDELLPDHKLNSALDRVNSLIAEQRDYQIAVCTLCEAFLTSGEVLWFLQIVLTLSRSRRKGVNQPISSKVFVLGWLIFAASAVSGVCALNIFEFVALRSKSKSFITPDARVSVTFKTLPTGYVISLSVLVALMASCLHLSLKGKTVYTITSGDVLPPSDEVRLLEENTGEHPEENTTTVNN